MSAIVFPTEEDWRRSLLHAFAAGFDASAEGFNGEVIASYYDDDVLLKRFDAWFEQAFADNKEAS